MKQVLTAFGLIAFFASSITPAAAADTLRRLDYSVRIVSGNHVTTGNLAIDYVENRGDGAVTVDLSEQLNGSDPQTVRALIEADGTIISDVTELTQSALALLPIVALESENLGGVDPGDAWNRTTAIPGGHATTHFSATDHDRNGTLKLLFDRTLLLDNRAHSAWHGNVSYDTNAFMPREINLTGSAREANAEQPHTMAMSLRLANDTYAKR
jgi:hypothetical protein